MNVRLTARERVYMLFDDSWPEGIETHRWAMRLAGLIGCKMDLLYY
jgi:hypothetical protein